MRINQTFSSEFGSLTIEREETLVDKLRYAAKENAADGWLYNSELCDKAADEIQRLNEKVADLEKQSCVRQLDLLLAQSLLDDELGENCAE